MCIYSVGRHVSSHVQRNASSSQRLTCNYFARFFNVFSSTAKHYLQRRSLYRIWLCWDFFVCLLLTHTHELARCVASTPVLQWRALKSFDATCRCRLLIHSSLTPWHSSPYSFSQLSQHLSLGVL